MPTTRFVVRLTPRGGEDRIGPVVEGVLTVRVKAAPVDGAANEALIRLLSGALDVPRTRVRLVSGASNRRKLIEVEELDAASLKARWPGLDV